jgi:hypothetical protein
MSRRAIVGLQAGFWLLVATEVAYVLLWRDPPIWPGIVIVALALVVGLLILLSS